MKKIMLVAVCLVSLISLNQSVYSEEVPNNIREEVVQLLQKRDLGVENKDIPLFKSTLTENAVGTNVEGFMKFDKTKTELINLKYYNDKNKNKLIGFIKKTSFKDGKVWAQYYFMQIYTKPKDAWLVNKNIFEKQ